MHASSAKSSTSEDHASRRSGSGKIGPSRSTTRPTEQAFNLHEDDFPAMGGPSTSSSSRDSRAQMIRNTAELSAEVSGVGETNAGPAREGQETATSLEAYQTPAGARGRGSARGGGARVGYRGGRGGNSGGDHRYTNRDFRDTRESPARGSRSERDRDERYSEQQPSHTYVPKMAALPEQEFGSAAVAVLGMTARDLDTVVRVHLRQLESQDVYLEDYYLLQYCARNNLSVDDLQVHMAVSTTFANFVKRSREANMEKSNKGNQMTESEWKEANAARNVEILSTALGTLRTWTPKAPRKLVAVSDEVQPNDSNRPAAQGSPSMNPLAGLASLGGNLETRRAVLKQNSVALLREDERVRARALIEHGYDIFAELRDIERGQLEALTYLGPAVKSLEDQSTAAHAAAEELAAKLLFGVLQLDDPGKILRQ